MQPVHGRSIFQEMVAKMITVVLTFKYDWRVENENEECFQASICISLICRAEICFVSDLQLDAQSKALEEQHRKHKHHFGGFPFCIYSYTRNLCFPSAQ